jgi:ABC-2 type transport system ATP-binding protein
MIHVEGLTKDYGDLRAVDHIDFDVQKGEIMGLLGPNGAGKTSTLRMLTGFLRPTAGEIRVKDLRLNERPLEIKKLLGYLPESAPLYHEMLVYDYLHYIAKIRELEGKRRSGRIRELADLCGVREVMHQPIGELSRGFKQRVGLAHVLMNDPEILILDEPTSGLDPNQIVEIREIIRQIGREKTIIFSTHILSEAEATCDRIVIINRGQIVADGSTETIKQTAGGEYHIHLSIQNAEMDSVEKEIGPLEGIVKTELLAADEGTLHIRLTCRSTEDIRGALYEKIKGTDWILLELHQETLSLENIFRQLTREG